MSDMSTGSIDVRTTDAQEVDVTRAGPLAGRDQESYHGVPPIKPAPFEMPHIPLYFWAGGIAAGSWIVATAEQITGGDDRDVVRAGRWLTAASLATGACLLIADLGRPERFLNMLRVLRPRSAMSVGSWALSAFGAHAGAAALLQMGEDGWLGDRPALARMSTGPVGRALHLAGLPVALVVGSYTGVLLAATATPSWAERKRLLPALFVASATSSGFAAVSAALEAAGGVRPSTARRLARAQAVTLAGELALHVADERASHRLESAREESPGRRLARRATTIAGMVAPLLLSIAQSRVAHAADDDEPRRRRSGLRIAGAALALAGGLALRFLAVDEGKRSANTPADTWAHTALEHANRDG